MNILKYGTSYYVEDDIRIKINSLYFHRLFRINQFKNQSSEKGRKELSIFYEILDSLDNLSKKIIFEKYFKYATMQQSKNKKRCLNIDYVITHLSNKEHAKKLNMSVYKYSSLLENALRKYITELAYKKVHQ